jgi:hypothetical protein
MGPMAALGTFGRRGLFLLGAVLGVASCLSPTLPLPPPSAPQVSAPDAAGFSRIQGRVRSQASVFVENLSTLRIAGQKTDETGDYEVEIGASVGDRLAVWYETGNNEQSPPTEVTVPGPEAGGAGGAP